MAKIQIKMPDEFLNKISRLGDKTDEILPRVLRAGGEVVLAKVRGNLRSVIGRNLKERSRSTGELAGALGISPAKVDDAGMHNVKVGFAEPHSGGVSNAKLANILEYGKHGQPPKPFLKPAKSASRKPCIDAMKTALEEEINSLNK